MFCMGASGGKREMRKCEMPTSVSVIIPSYNRRELLQRALESVQQQSHAAAEIIVVDDGSSDGTAAMIAEKYPDVICLHHTNHGVSFSRNRGVELAKSHWVAFLDSDDVWLPTKLESQIAALQESPGYQLCHTDEIWIRKGVRVNAMNKHRKRGGNIYLDCLHLCLISPSSVMLTKDLFLEQGGFDEELPACEDYDLWLRICADNEVLYLDEPLLMKYGGHDDQLSQCHWGMDRFRVKALEKMLQRENLGQQLYDATKEVMLKKCQILVNGALKRDNHEVAEAYQQKIVEYS
jgi:glycosyltransferase involved in cell wall biosynthesis